MKKTILIEIIDDNNLAIYQDDGKHIINDAKLSDLIDYKWILLEPIHSFAQTFSHKATEKIKDNKLLTQIISAHFEPLLIGEKDDYVFAWKNNILGQFWVAWITKSQLKQIQTRFAKYQDNIIALTNSALFFNYFLNDAESTDTQYIANSPFIYIIEKSQCTSHYETSFNVDNNAQNLRQVAEKNTYSKILAALQKPNSQKNFPNLITNNWDKQQQDSVTKTLPINWWFAGTALALLAFLAAQYIKVRHLNQYENIIKNQQVNILKQAVPDAKSTQPYSRLKAEYKQNSLKTSNNIDLSRLRLLDKTVADFLSKQNLHLLEYGIDHQNNHINIVFGEINSKQKQDIIDSLKALGFKANANNSNNTNNTIDIEL